MDKLTNDEQYFDQSFNKLTAVSAEFSAIEFEECTFTECDFSDTTFVRCKFLNCSFVRCNLSLMKVPYTRIFEVDFTECKLIGIEWTKANWPSFHLDSELSFTQCILNDSSFFELTLHELKFEHCKLHDVDFRGGDFTDATMIYCDFSNSVFLRTNLQGVDFSESIDFNIDVLENKLSRAKFTRFEALSLLETLGIELVD